jgi:hypothetical protein
MDKHSERAVTWPPGLALFPTSSPPEGNHAFSVLANEVILIFDSSLFNARAVSSRSNRNGQGFGSWLNELQARKKRSTSSVVGQQTRQNRMGSSDQRTTVLSRTEHEEVRFAAFRLLMER